MCDHIQQPSTKSILCTNLECDQKFKLQCLKCLQKNCSNHCPDWFTINDFHKFKLDFQERLFKCQILFQNFQETLSKMEGCAKQWSTLCQASIQKLQNSCSEELDWGNHEQISFDFQLKMQSKINWIETSIYKITDELKQFSIFVINECLNQRNIKMKQNVQSKKDEKTLFLEAVRLNNLNYVDQALVKITESIKKCPSDYFLYYCKGNIHYNQCQFKEALISYDKSLQLKHTKICLVAKVETMLQLSQYQEIIDHSIKYQEDFKKGFELRMFKGTIVNYAGVALFWLRRFQESEQLFTELKFQHPNNSTQWEGFIERCQKEWAKAQMSIEEILRQSDKNIASNLSRRSLDDESLKINKINLDTRYWCHFMNNFQNADTDG